MRHAIAAGFRIASRKTADDRAHVHAAAELLLAHSEPLEPAEHSFAGGVGERPPVFDLVRAGSLSDEHHARAKHGAGDRFAENVRTSSARGENFQVFGKGALLYHRKR